MGLYTIAGKLLDLREDEESGGERDEVQWDVSFHVVGEMSECPINDKRCVEFPLEIHDEGRKIEKAVKWCKGDEMSLYDFAVSTCEYMRPVVTCVEKSS